MSFLTNFYSSACNLFTEFLEHRAVTYSWWFLKNVLYIITGNPNEVAVLFDQLDQMEAEQRRDDFLKLFEHLKPVNSDVKNQEIIENLLDEILSSIVLQKQSVEDAKATYEFVEERDEWMLYELTDEQKEELEQFRDSWEREVKKLEDESVNDSGFMDVSYSCT